MSLSVSALLYVLRDEWLEAAASVDAGGLSVGVGVGPDLDPSAPDALVLVGVRSSSTDAPGVSTRVERRLSYDEATHSVHCAVDVRDGTGDLVATCDLAHALVTAMRDRAAGDPTLGGRVASVLVGQDMETTSWVDGDGAFTVVDLDVVVLVAPS